jgi:hypothetical protein
MEFRAAFLIAILFAITSSCRSPGPDESANLTMCQSHLHNLALVVSAYRQDHEERFPPSLARLMTESGMSDGVSRLLVCPGLKSATGGAALSTESASYIFVNWSAWFLDERRVPPEFPLFYDRRLANHAGNGVNVVQVNGTVFWDLHCKWLKDFSASNPKYGIRVPP